MATGKLTNVEKHAIKSMLSENKTVAEIAVELGRTEATVTKYVSGELDGIVDTIVRAKMASASKSQEEQEAVEDVPVEPLVKEPVRVSSEIMMETIHKLKAAGFKRDNAKELIQRILRKLEFEPDNAQQLYAICIRYINTKDTMITEAAGGRKGVVAMTAAASERIDEFHKNHAAQGTRKVRECVFQPKDGKMLSDG